MDGRPSCTRPSMETPNRSAPCLMPTRTRISRDTLGVTALHLAARSRTEIVSLLVRGGATLDARTKSQITPLGLAASHGSLETVRFLLAAGADAKGGEEHQQTWLMSAAYGGHLEVMGALVAAGADVMARDSDGNTALTNAAYVERQIRLGLRFSF